jgi:hypothetical protein
MVIMNGIAANKDNWILEVNICSLIILPYLPIYQQSAGNICRQQGQKYRWNMLRIWFNLKSMVFVLNAVILPVIAIWRELLPK